MAEIGELVFYLYLGLVGWVSHTVYGKVDGKRNWYRINLFRSAVAALAALLLWRPTGRYLGYDYPPRESLWMIGLALVLLVMLHIGIGALAYGEGHHDTGWNHRRGWLSLAFFATILFLFWKWVLFNSFIPA